MADDLGFQPISQQPTDDVGFQPIPKMPDVSGVQKMAQDNLAANANKEVGAEPKPPQTPAERLNTAAGFPVDKVINGTATPSDFDTAHRDQYVKALDNGSAVNSSDWLQTMVRAVAPIAAGAIQRTQASGRIAEQVRQGIGEGYEGGTLVDASDRSDVGQILGAAANILPQALGSAYSGFQKGAVQIGSEIGQPALGRDLAIFPEAMIGAEGMKPHVPEALRDPVAKKVSIDPASVTPEHVDQTLAQGAKDILPAQKDFEAVSTVTGIPESSLKIVFKETGVKPDQVFADAQRDPTVATDVAAGKVPEQYEHLVEEKPVLPPKQAEKLTVAKDDATRSFTVVDKEGDHVSGGFDSHEEAQHFIEDEKFKAEERAAIEEEGKGKTQAVLAGESEVIPALEISSEVSGRPSNITRPIDSPITQEPLRHTSEATPPEGVFTTRAISPSTSEGGVKTFSLSNIRPLYHKITDLSALKEAAAKSKGDLDNLLQTISKNVKGVIFDGSRLKNEGRLGEKLSTKKPNQISDYLASRMVVDTPEAARRIVEQLKQFSHVIKVDDYMNDEGKPSGYRAIHVQIMGDNGLSAEVQIQPREIKEVYSEARQIYTKWRGNESEISSEEYLADQEKQKSLFNDAWNKFKDRVQEFSKSEKGELNIESIKKSVGDTITTAEKFVGKLTGGFFEKLADGYMRTFQPELMGDKALRADAYLAKFKAAGQEAENAYYRQSAESKKMFDKMTTNERLEWLYDHETGRWNEEDDADHARFQALYDAMHEAEQKAIGTETGYKENYLPHQWENPEAVETHFRSEAMIKKFGADWFKKASEFNLIQEGVRAGFKLRTDNPESMLVARQLASSSMIRTMDLLHDMESSGIAKRATAFGIDRKIAKTQEAITELQEKYKKEFEKKNNPNQPALIEGLPPAESKVMKIVEKRLDDLKARLEAFTKEKVDNKLTPEQMKELKGGFRVIGPDSKVWNIDQQVAPLWKNAMEMKGLYENQGLTGDAYRAFSQIKNIWTDLKLSLSLFHPFHEVGINLASAIVAPVDHLIQGGKFSDLAWRDVTSAIPTGSGRGIDAYNTAPEARTPEQHADVQRMIEGGFVPTMSARDMVHFKDNWDKAIAKVGVNNLRLIGTALQLPGKIFEPLFSKWIPRLRSEMYFSLTDKALARDPTLAADAGRRGEAYREISKNIDRTFGQLNQDTLFWNKNVRDAFNASYISGGWKLAQIYNARGLLEPLNIAYKFAKTGEFSKADITYNMLHAYAYTAVTLTMGAAINKMLGNPIGKTLDEAKSIKDYVWSIVEDCLFPKTGDKNPDGTPIRLNQPAFTKEYFMAARDINENGLIGGAGKFIYQGTIIPGIMNTLTNRDFIGHEQISNPTDLHQWTNAGWDAINPITLSTYERAEQKGSAVGKYAGLAGFPIAGAYINQTPFEQKVIAKYDEQNPPKGDAYQAKLKAEMRGAIANKDTEAEAKIEKQMKDEGMSSEQISHSKTAFKTPFADFAWTKLSAEDQKRLIESASDEEKKKFKVKSQ